MKLFWISDFRRASSSEVGAQSVTICQKLSEKGVEPVLCNLVPLDIRVKSVETEVQHMRLIYPVGDILSHIQAVDPDVVVVYGVLETALYSELPDIIREYPTVYYSLFDPIEVLLDPQYASSLPSIVDFMQKVDHVIVPSENMKTLAQAYGCTDISLIPIGLDPTKYSPTTCRDPTIVLIAKTAAIRNHLTLIEAISLVRETVPEVELAIVPWRELIPKQEHLVRIYTELLQQLGLTAQVKFIAPIAPDHLFKEVSILADPSFSTAVPSAVLFAYLYGVPCVLSDAGWSRMFEAPLKAKHDDPQDWADNLIRLLTDDDVYLTVRTNQQTELIQKFDIHKTIDNFITVFEELIQLQPYKVKRGS